MANIPLKRKLNTKVVEIGEIKTVQLYDTIILTVKENTVVFNTGGFNTVTTRRRINQACKEFGLDWSVYQRKGRLYAGKLVEGYQAEEIEFLQDWIEVYK